MDAAGNQAGRNLSDRQPRLMGGFDRPHSFELSIGQAEICGFHSFNEALFALDLLSPAPPHP